MKVTPREPMSRDAFPAGAGRLVPVPVEAGRAAARHDGILDPAQAPSR